MFKHRGYPTGNFPRVASSKEAGLWQGKPAWYGLWRTPGNVRWSRVLNRAGLPILYASAEAAEAAGQALAEAAILIATKGD